MELVKNIFFNTDKLTANSKVKSSYTGKFFQDNSQINEIELPVILNEKNEWDNNNGNNYIFPIEHPDVALAVVEEKSIAHARKLRKTYLISKKLRLAIYKIIISIPKLISGNYRRKEKQADS